MSDYVLKVSEHIPESLARIFSGPYRWLYNKYFVDEFYNVIIVRPLLLFSTYFLGWVVDKAILGGAVWLLGGTATFAGALLQRWQSGNLRSYAAWLTAGAAALLLFILVPWSTVLANVPGIREMVGH